MKQEETAPVEYVNTQQATTPGIAVGDLVAYVEGKKRQDGFKIEYEVG